MVQIVQQSDDEKMDMYMKLSKRELASMVIQCNRVIESMGSTPTVSGNILYQMITSAQDANPGALITFSH